jgi:transketolase
MTEIEQHLVPNVSSPEIKQEPTRAGFGRGLTEAAMTDKSIVALCADLTESTKMDEFAKSFRSLY